MSRSAGPRLYDSISARGLVAAAALALAIGTACYNPTMVIDKRSALEQQLTRTAIWRSIQGLAVHKDVREGRWRIKVLAPEPYDESWIRGSLEIRLSELGVALAPMDDDEASLVIAGVVHAGSDIDNFYVGVPIPGGAGQALAFYQSITGRGRTEMFLSFQDPHGRTIGMTELSKASTHYTDMYFLTIFGPVALTDLEIATGERFRELGRDTLHEAGETAGEWILPVKNSMGQATED